MKQRLSGLALEFWLPIVALLVWWFASASWNSPYFPSLEDILKTFEETWFSDRFETDVLPTLARFATGYAIALVAGTVLGVILGLSRTLRRMFEPSVDFFRALPKTALLPVFIVLMGVGEEMKVGLIAFGAMWPVLLNAMDGVRGIEPTFVDMSRVYKLSRRDWIRRVVLPAASPQIFAGARLALAIALILLLVSEMLASTNGVGYFILESQQTFAIPQMWAGLLMFGLIGYAVNLIFVAVEGRVLAWHRGWRAAMLGRSPEAATRKRAGFGLRRGAGRPAPNRSSNTPPSKIGAPESTETL
jgi:sulfonate transport system permease protein